ncbi:MAG: aldo/keto reductase [Clostridia bacterium]|nr:aldo/keto reductase [Clostridia bacterium]
MLYNEMGLSMLGFGLMRLPMKDGEIDEAETARIIDYAIKNGVNYFDTAYPYHEGKSELVIGKILKNYPRDKVFLADKYPGHQLFKEHHPEEIFEEQLKKCQVEYFDYYLLHNVNDESVLVYEDERWNLIDYFVEQKRLGRIKHLGFSCHSSPEVLYNFLKKHPDVFEFCQIQYNYMDEELQDGALKYKYLEEFGVPIWVMEPVRGGKLAEPNERLKELRPAESEASWAFRWLLNKPQVKLILSGMSNMDQVVDNINTFNGGKPLDEEEMALLAKIADEKRHFIPCTACRYCVSQCPQNLDIPKLLQYYNEGKFQESLILGMSLEFKPNETLPSACLACGSCEQICPQGIKISECMKELDEMLTRIPKWKDLCEERERAAAALKEK